jgi:uncharacterized protein
MGLLRLAIWVALGYLLYRVVKRVFKPSAHLEDRSDGIIDEMVKDPQCETYIPRRQAKKRVVGGQTHFFCSDACADRFEEAMKK